MRISLLANPHLFTRALFLLVLVLAAPAWSADKSPINIEADRMVSLEQKNSVLFSGNVLATQADVKIRSNEMTVYYSQAAKGKGQGQEVKKLLCVGNVEITRGDWLGTGNKMDYLAQERKVILTGNAKAWQGKNQVSGETIVYYIDEGRSEVVPSKASATSGKKGGRVKATIIPK
ncbi:MAG: lipopolysaccharide transport periplasmic protein LptA [Proteobacteria bacterium]|nr:lipopolysaccharide transport periplasmic protein LptA [Pseudomonadota bacterium]MBU1649676.1 lipopolysaccharide transport periplasmic protein LptA [Pseudomonadota bacterium]MBU1985977.1 lipopolysaccharide transport periplasmic protein LptA [Pseudomonadota bacterium]